MKTADPAKSTKKKILVISYHFPPSRAIGGLRAFNFVKYLPSFGWIPRVLTIEDRYLDEADWERVKEVETVRIIKAGKLPTLRDAYLCIKKTGYRILKKDFGAQEKSGIPGHSSNGGPSDTETLSQRLKRYIISLFLTLPDTDTGWIIPAVLRAVREIKKEKIDCILTSCPPYSVHLIGILVKMLTGVTWVADFRDPWMTTGTKKIFPTSALSNKIESWLEGKVIQRADLLLFNTNPLRDAYKEKYPSETANKFVHIPNGIDQTIFSQLASLKKNETFTLSYTGSLYIDRSPEPVFKAMSQLLLDGKVSPGEVVIKLVGSCRFVGSYPVSRMARDYGLDSIVEISDPVPYRKALEIIRQSHLALIFAPNQPFQIPGKVYDYIGTGARILAIAEKSATSDLLHSTNCGKAFHPSDIEGIKDFIFQTMTSEPSSEEDYSMDVSRFDARRITESLSNNLDGIVVQRRYPRKRENLRA